MKKVFVGLLVLSLVGLVVPKLIGDTAYDVYKQSLANSPMDKGLVSIEHRDYAQSWFSSDVVTVFKYEAADPKAETMELILNSHIQHGPVMFSDEGIKFGLAFVDTKTDIKGFPQETQAVMDNILSKLTLTMTSLIAFDKQIHNVFKVGSYTHEKDGVVATFGGFEVVGTALLDYAKMDGSITLHASSLKSPDFKLDIATSEGSYDLRKYAESMMLGNMQGEIPSIDVVAKQVPVSLKNIVFSADETEENKFLYFNQQFAIKAIKAPVPVQALQYDTELNQLSLEAVQGWIDFSKNMNPKAKAGLTEEEKNQLRELASLALQDGLELNQYLKLDGMGGALIIDWDTRYVGLPHGEHLWDVPLADKKKILQALMMHIVLTIDKAVVDATPFAGLVAPYIQQGFIVEEAGLLKADITLANNVLTVNNQKLPVEALLALLPKKQTK